MSPSSQENGSATIMRSRRSPEIHKFGGAALADASGMCRAARIVAEHGGVAPVVVASALAGVTDMLVAITRTTLREGDALPGILDELHARHVEALESTCAADAGSPRQWLERDHGSLTRVLQAVRELGFIGPRERARILAYGERVSARILAAHLCSTGVNAEYLDGADVVVTIGNHDDAVPDLAATRERARTTIRALHDRGVVPVVPGFIGAAADGAVSTLGRGGSDMTATVLAWALYARKVVLWKDVPGMLTADPRSVPDARIIPRLSVHEALELSQLGARVLHPRALAVLGERCRVLVRPFADPNASGTSISRARIRAPSPVRAIAARVDQALVVVASDVLRPSSLVARVHEALADAGIDARMLSSSFGGGEVALLIEGSESAGVVEALRRSDLRSGALNVMVRPGLATVGVVGAGIGGDARVASRVLHALADAGVELIAADQVSGRDSLTMLVDGTSAIEAQRALHAVFQLHQAGGGRMIPAGQRDVLLLGLGGIARQLIEQLPSIEGVYGGRLRICGVVDRSGFVFDARGLSRRLLESLVAAKETGAAVATHRQAVRGSALDALRLATDHALSDPILVDATAAATGEILLEALECGWDLVLANKLPLAGTQTMVDRLRDVERLCGRRVEFEATVGAGLPVIDTLRRLQEAGDTVRRIEGCPSGTLGFIFAQLGRGVAFSECVLEAMRRGYTEPDPRADLSGSDVARKALILARLIGFRGEPADVVAESLVPDSLEALPHEEFLTRLAECDKVWAARVHEARARGRVLRYRIRVTRQSVRAGIVAVPESDPLGRLDGTDNQFTFTTSRYREQPLVITGPGAGAVVTAAGVLGDLLRLAEPAAKSGVSARPGGARPVTARPTSATIEVSATVAERTRTAALM